MSWAERLLITEHDSNLCMIWGWQETGEPLIQRKDDTVEVLTKRLTSFHEQTTPVSRLLLTVFSCAWFQRISFLKSSTAIYSSHAWFRRCNNQFVFHALCSENVILWDPWVESGFICSSHVLEIMA